ncbi:MAG: hypothetical protein NT067_03165 [Candidatus Diapherotrites archaeon]|nr:hypothetical protein [Candidatus Diapherotrites archaeon]
MDCRKTAFLAVVALAVLISLSLAGCSQPEKKPAFEWGAGSAFYQSDAGEPKELLRGFSIEPKVVVAAELWLGEPGKNADIFNNAFIPFYAVVAGNDRNAIQLIIFKDSGGQISKCHTNYGDVKTQEVLGRAECEAFLAAEDHNLTILFRIPDASLSRSVIWLDSSRATVRAKNTEDLVILSRSLALQLYPNASEILEKTKEKLGQLDSNKTGTQ